jgi:hypothetical protein
MQLTTIPENINYGVLSLLLQFLSVDADNDNRTKKTMDEVDDAQCRLSAKED